MTFGEYQKHSILVVKVYIIIQRVYLCTIQNFTFFIPANAAIMFRTSHKLTHLVEAP